MTRAGAIVHQRMAVLPLQKRSYIGHSDFHLQSGRHPIESLEPPRLLVLSMLMQVDEARRHDQPARIDYASADERFSAHANDLPVIDTDIPDGVEAGLRVHNPATLHDQLVGLSKRRC